MEAEQIIQPYKCVIMANGSFPQAQLPLKLLHEASAIIACDGAIETLHSHGLDPIAIVGDLDSIPEELRKKYANRIHHIKDQEINDLTKAVLYAKESGFREVLILGATGLREDHTLGNISLLIDYTPLFQRIEMLSDFGLFTPLLHTATLPSVVGQQISIFSLTPDKEISVQNLRWPIDHRKLTNWWQGTLNEALGREFTITLQPESQVIIYRNIF